LEEPLPKSLKKKTVSGAKKWNFTPRSVARWETPKMSVNRTGRTNGKGKHVKEEKVQKKKG